MQGFSVVQKINNPTCILCQGSELQLIRTNNVFGATTNIVHCFFLLSYCVRPARLRTARGQTKRTPLEANVGLNMGTYSL
jgi:hypothetical protein